MRKERARRYRSASELADDIDNYLKGAPLLAGPESTMYRARKLVRRHQALATGLAAVLAVLVAGVVVSTLLAVGQARARAEAQLVTNFLIRDVLSSASKIKGREPTVVDFLDAAVAKLDEGQFGDRPLIEIWIRAALAWTYYDLGRYAVAAQHQKPVHRIREEQLGKDHPQTNAALNMLAVYYYHAGMYREAEPLYRQVIKKAYQHEAGFLVEKRLTWNANLGTTLAGLGRYEEAEQLLRPKVEVDPLPMYGLHLGEIYRELGKYEAAERVLRNALALGREQDKERNDAQFASGMVRCMHELGLLRLAQGDDHRAEELFAEGIEYGDRELPGKDHPHMLRNVNGLATIRIRQHRYEEAESLLERALAGQELKLGRDHPDTLKTLHDFGILRREQGELEEAEKRLSEALEARQAKLSHDHPHTLASVCELGVLYMAQSDYEKAQPLLLDVYNGREAKLGPEHPHTIDSLRELVGLYESCNKPEEAAKWRAKLPRVEDGEEQD